MQPSTHTHRPAPGTATRTRPDARSVRTHRPAGVVAAGLVALAGWVVADPLLGVDLAVRTGGAGTVRDVGPVAAVSAGLLSGLAGWLLLVLLEQVTVHAHRLWRGIALVVLLVSLVGVAEAVTVAGAVALGGLHVLVGATLVALLPGGAADD
jgi:hypothetical protein